MAANHFEPITNEPDRCANCRKPFMDHHSGQCDRRADEQGKRKFIENGPGHFSVYSDEVSGKMQYVGVVEKCNGRWSAKRPGVHPCVYAPTRREAVGLLL